MAVIIPRNSVIPSFMTKEFFCAYENQTEAQIQIYEGESKKVAENHKLDEFSITGIEPRPAGQAKV